MDGPFLINADGKEAQHCQSTAAVFADHVICGKLIIVLE